VLGADDDDGRVARSVLVVDDHPSFRLSARLLLESEGYRVVGEAASAHEALELAGRLAPDLVLLDVGLPDGNGFGVAQRLLAARPPPAIVLTSTRDQSDFGPLIARSGARGFVAKPDLSGAALAALLA
jgi:DNA-binding NarL/FixJ family response regulator